MYFDFQSRAETISVSEDLSILSFLIAISISRELGLGSIDSVAATHSVHLTSGNIIPCRTKVSQNLVKVAGAQYFSALQYE